MNTTTLLGRALRAKAYSAVGAWLDAVAHRASTSRRESLLEPNRGSLLKVERYDFSIGVPIVFGKAGPFHKAVSPLTTFRPQTCSANVPSVGVCFFAIRVANVEVTIGEMADAYAYAALARAQLDLPTMSPGNKLYLTGHTTEHVPVGFAGGEPFQFTVTFQGPASIVG